MVGQAWRLLYLAVAATVGWATNVHSDTQARTLLEYPDSTSKLTNQYQNGAGGLGGYSSRSGWEADGLEFDNLDQFVNPMSVGPVGFEGYGGYNTDYGVQGYGAGYGGGYGGGYGSNVIVFDNGGGKKGHKGKSKGYKGYGGYGKGKGNKSYKSHDKGKGKGRYKGKGKGYDYNYDYYDDTLLIKQPVIVNRPVVVQKPAVEYQTVAIKAPQPKYQPPVLIHKPVIYKTKEWRLVDVPKVHYTPQYVQPHHGAQYYQPDKKAEKGKWWKKGKGGGWWR